MANKITIICPKCGSDDVVCDATARWSVENQCWELSGTFDDKTCQQCEYENDSFSDKDLVTGEITPEDGISYEPIQQTRSEPRESIQCAMDLSDKGKGY